MCNRAPSRGLSFLFRSAHGYRGLSGPSQRAFEGEKRSKGNERVLETSLVIGNTTCNSSVDSLMPRFVPLAMKTALNRLVISLSLSFSFLIRKRNLFSLATKTRLIWNLDFKNNFRKGILFLNRIRNFYSFLKEREIYIETLQWRGNLQICVRASIRKIRNNNNVAWIISLRQHQLLLFFVCFFFFALLLPDNFTSPRENNFIPLFAKVD